VTSAAETSTAISEAVAEKPKRGRPRLWAKDIAEFVAPERGERKQRDAYYLCQAIGILDDHVNDYEHRFAWLHCGMEAKKNGADYRHQPTILAELGRLAHSHGAANMLVMADAICTYKPPAKRTVAKLRTYRLQRSPDADSLSLACSMVMAVRDYWHKHPNTTKEVIAQALEIIQVMIRDDDDDGFEVEDLETRNLKEFIELRLVAADSPLFELVVKDNAPGEWPDRTRGADNAE
jgi:hypothetical protein